MVQISFTNLEQFDGLFLGRGIKSPYKVCIYTGSRGLSLSKPGVAFDKLRPHRYSYQGVMFLAGLNNAKKRTFAAATDLCPNN